MEITKKYEDNSEFLQIVDENNNLTGKIERRKKIHTEGLWHRTLHVYLFRKKENKLEILVHLRSFFKDLDPNRWDTRIGGHIKSWATLEESLKTESQEEIGLELNMEKLTEGKWRKRDNAPNREFSKVYYYQFDGNLSDLKFNDGEVQEIKWMIIEDIEKSMRENPEKWAGNYNGFLEISEYLKNKHL